LSNSQVIADSTFYLVFLLDIDKPLYLNRIIEAHDFLLPPVVDTEIYNKLSRKGKSPNYHHIETGIKNNQITKLGKRVDLGMITNLVAGKANPNLGEYHVIAYSYHIIKKDPHLCIIIDDKDAIDKVKAKKKLTHIYKRLKWSTDLITECFTSSILNKRECLQIFYDMKKVKSEKPNAGALKIPYWMYDKKINEVKSYKK
jgi:hypothetical protein